MGKENSEKIKILRIINRFNIGGPIWNVALLTKHLPENYETKLVGGQANVTEASAMEILEKLNITASILPSMSRKLNLTRDLKAFFELRKIIREFKPQIVHTHASKAGFLGRLAAFTSGVPVVVHTYHGHVFESYFGKIKSSLIKHVERLLALKTTAVVAISEAQKKAINEQFRICASSKTHVIPLGFDLTPFHPNAVIRLTARKEYQLNDATIAVGIVGRLTPIKNHEMFLNAAHLVVSNSPLNYRFFIAGDGEMKTELQEHAELLGISHKVVFTSWIFPMDRFYAAMDLICLTSLNEGTPVTLIEAQAAGIPVISTDVGGVKNTLINHETGLLLSSFDSKELAEKIEYLSTHREKRIQMSKNAHTFAVEQHSYSQLIGRMDNLYQKLLNDA